MPPIRMELCIRDRYHAVLYLRISIFHSIVYSFRRSVGVTAREAAVHSDFQINIYPVPKQAGVYLVYAQHMPLFQRCVGNDLNSVFRTGAVHHFVDGIEENGDCSFHNEQTDCHRGNEMCIRDSCFYNLNPANAIPIELVALL